MTNRELVTEILGSNMDSQVKGEVIDLIYLYRIDSETKEIKHRKKRAITKPAGSDEEGGA